MTNMMLFPSHRKSTFLFLAAATVLGIEHILQAFNSTFDLTDHLEQIQKAESSSFAAPLTRSQQDKQNQVADGSSSNLSVETLETRLNLILDRWRNLAAETYAIYPKSFPCGDTASQDEVTITVHFGVSPEKFRRLLLIQRRWDGPISVAILIKSEKDILELFVVLNDYSEQLTRTTVHIMMEKTVAQYPHNSLREIALQHIDSDYFLTLDVDFVTSPHAHAELYHLLQTNDKVVQALRNNTMMVLPAFNLEQHLSEEQVMVGDQHLPANKSQAMEWLQQGKITEFHVQVFFAGHGPTDYTHWYRDLLEEAPFYPIQYGFKFEPYVLGYKRNVPHFWEGFRGFGYNKYSWFVEAFYMDFSFAVLRDFFVVHLDHAIAAKDISMNSLNQMDRFKAYLQKKYRVHNDDLELIQSKGNKIMNKLDKAEQAGQEVLQTPRDMMIGFQPKVVVDEYYSKLPMREPSKVFMLPSVKKKVATITAMTLEEKKQKNKKRFENRAGIRARRAEELARKKEHAQSISS